MGRLIEKIGVERGHTIAAKLSTANLASFEGEIAQVDLCIDFSHPDCVVENIRRVAHQGKNIVVGTTGWYDDVEEVKRIVRDHSIGLLYGPNFSLGVHLFLQIVAEAARRIDAFSQYDVGIVEQHHQQKVDSPSGTAKAIASVILDQVKRKTKVVDHPSLNPNELSISSLRCGAVPGTHTVIIDAPEDTIRLTHEARNREGFALGAIIAAEWLQGKKGIFTVEDLFK